MQDEKWLNARGLALQNIRVRGGRSFGIAALSLSLNRTHPVVLLPDTALALRRFTQGAAVGI